MKLARIETYNDLVHIADNEWWLNFQKRKSNGSVRINSNDLSSVWDCSFDFVIGHNFKWGSREYDPVDRRGDFLCNMKLFRLWNPGSTNENCYVGMMGWEPNLHFTCENMGNQNWRFMHDYKARFTPGVKHQFRFQFRENSKPGRSDGWIRVSFDGEVVFEKQNLITRINAMGLKRPFILGFDDVWDPGVYDVNNENRFLIDNIVASMELISDLPPVDTIDPPIIEPPIKPPIIPPGHNTYSTAPEMLNATLARIQTLERRDA